MIEARVFLKSQVKNLPDREALDALATVLRELPDSHVTAHKDRIEVYAESVVFVLDRASV